MTHTIEENLLSLEKQLENLLALAKGLTEEQFYTQHSPEEWSICQVMEHLFASESGTLGYMLKKSSSGWDQLETEGPEQIEKGAALTKRLQTNEKFKAPAVLPEPANTTPFSTFESEWPRLRQQLHQFVNNAPTEHRNKLIFKQPYAGMISLAPTISFLKTHLAHHEQQVLSIIQRFTH
jgi:DinB superfamily